MFFKYLLDFEKIQLELGKEIKGLYMQCLGICDYSLTLYVKNYLWTIDD